MIGDTVHLEADFTLIQDQFTGVCRRKAQRFHFALGAVGYLTFQKDGTSQEVWLHDISELGISFCTDWPLDTGTTLLLKLTSFSRGPIKLWATVVHATKQARGDWRIGCKFSERLTPEILDQLL